MKKRIASIFAVCLALLVFVGCYKPIEDNVITGVNKIGKTAVIYIDFEGVFAAAGIEIEPGDEYAAGYYPKGDASFESKIVMAKEDSHGWGIKVPLEESAQMGIQVVLKKGGTNYTVPEIIYDSNYACTETPDVLCVTVSEL